MSLTYQKVIEILTKSGIESASGWMLMDRLLEPVSIEKVQEIANACLDALPDELVRINAVGGGKVTRTPYWVKEAGDCESHSFVLFAWLIIGNWHKAVKTGTDRGGMAAGPVIYTARPRAENNYRDGRHSILWHIDHDEVLRFFEFGDNSPATMTEEELASVTNGFAA